MAEPQGYLGRIRVAYADPAASPPSWSKIEGVFDADVPQLESPDVDTTTYESGNYERSIPARAKVSDAVIRCLAGDALLADTPIQNGLFDLRANQTTKLWRIEVASTPDPDTDDLWEAFEYEARIGSFKPNAKWNDKKSLEFSLKYNAQTFLHEVAAASQIG